MAERTCTLCDSPHVARGLCSKHYQRAKLRGELTNLKRLTADEMYAKYATGLNGDCVEWTGYVGNMGYGFLCVDGKRHLAHRWAHERFIGPIPARFQVDHLCRNRRCVNPTHLEAVTQQENVARELAATVGTACRAGHPWTVDSTRWRPNGYRTCRICEAATKPGYNQRRRERRAADRLIIVLGSEAMEATG